MQKGHIDVLHNILFVRQAGVRTHTYITVYKRGKMCFFEEIQGENFFSHLLKLGQSQCSHQDLNPGGELSSHQGFQM
jgi:hypothetical protein